MITLDDLKRRMQRFDDMAEEAYMRAREVDPTIDDVIPIVIDPRGVVYLKGSLKTVVKSVDVINAIRLRSLKHIPMPGMTCIKCELKYDDYGYIVGCLHYMMNDEDTVVDGKVVEGLKTKIAKGKVRIKSDYEVEIL
ncbi:MAG: hypothetical protein QXT64_00785 [Desulfurococcaceae archaeon]